MAKLEQKEKSAKAVIKNLVSLREQKDLSVLGDLKVKERHLKIIFSIIIDNL